MKKRQPVSGSQGNHACVAVKGDKALFAVLAEVGAVASLGWPFKRYWESLSNNGERSSASDIKGSSNSVASAGLVYCTSKVLVAITPMRRYPPANVTKGIAGFIFPLINRASNTIIDNRTAQGVMLDLYVRLFVTSCGFDLIEQVAHGAANQVNHGDKVGLVPVATCT